MTSSTPNGEPATPKPPRPDLVDAGLVLVVVLTFVVVARLPFGPNKFGDIEYFNDAKALAASVRGAQAFSAVTISRAPAPVLYYAIPYAAVPAGSSDQAYWRAGVVWSAFWVIAGVLMIRRAARELGGETAGVAAAALVALSPFSVYYSMGVIAEPPAFLGACAFAYGWSRCHASRDTRPGGSGSWWLCWLGLALLLLSRPNAVLILPIGVAAAAAMWWNGTAALRKVAVSSLAGLALVVLVLVGSSALVRIVGGGWQKGMLGGIVFQGRYQYRTEPWNWAPFSTRAREGTSPDWDEYRRHFAELRARSRAEGIPMEALEWDWIRGDVLAHPALTLRMAGIRALTLNLFTVNSVSPAGFRVGPFSGNLAYATFHVVVNVFQLAVLAAALAYVFTTRGAWRDLWALWAPWAALFLFAALTYADHRYTFPGRPGLAILAGLLVERVWARARKRRNRGEIRPRTATAVSS